MADTIKEVSNRDIFDFFFSVGIEALSALAGASFEHSEESSRHSDDD